MSIKQSKEKIITHSELSANTEYKVNSFVPGFSTNLHLSLMVKGSEVMQKYFRTDYFHVFTITQGEGMLNINLKKYNVSKNSFVLTTPLDIKKVEFGKDCLHSVIRFTTEFLENTGLTKKGDVPLKYFSPAHTPVWTLSEEDAALMNKLIEQVHNQHIHCTKHPYGKELLSHFFCMLMYEMAAISNKYISELSSPVSRKEKLVMSFINCVRKHCKQQRSLQFYANELHITSKYLSETVKEITGKTAVSILNDFVIQEAKLLLNDASVSIAQIADEMQFSDQSFFGKFFKRNAGCSPKEYRNTA